MTERTRNVAVGITVIVALAMLAGMILIFAGLPQLFQGGYNVNMKAASTFDMQEGDLVYLAGMRVGRLVELRFREPGDPMAGVVMVAQIDSKINLPGNAIATVFTQGLVGQPYLEIKAEGDLPAGPDGEPMRYLPKDGSATVRVEHRGTAMLPDEAIEAMESISDLADGLNEMLEPSTQPTTQPGTQPSTQPAREGVAGLVRRLNSTLEGLDAIVGDAENQENLKTSLANLAEATDSTTLAMEQLKAFAQRSQETVARAEEMMGDVSQTSAAARENMNKLTARLIDNSDRLGQLLMRLNQVAARLESGDGTAARLLNDPRLYNNLVETTDELGQLVRQLQSLAEQWEATGVGVKVK